MSEKKYRLCVVDKCNGKHWGNGFCCKHYYRMKRHGHLGMTKNAKGTGHTHPSGYIYIGNNGVKKAVHVWIAEKALGKPLPKGAEVHHVDGNKMNNTSSNLVICPDNAYHKLLHKRERAYAACAHADWLKCTHCKAYDSPASVEVNRFGHSYHYECMIKFNRIRKAKKREEMKVSQG